MFDQIEYEVDDPVATITLSRPESMNAWTDRMDREVREAVRLATADPAVVGIVITGAGRAFCAGADMKTLDELSSADAAEAGGAAIAQPGTAPSDDEGGDFGGRFGYLMTVPKPVVAAINGAVAGMAYPFALSCDVRVLCPSSLFVTAFAQRGLIAEWGLGWLLPQVVGSAAALDLLFTSRRVGASEAFRLGLGNYLVDDDEELLPFCRDYVAGLASACSPASIAVMKRQVNTHLHRGLGVAEAEAQRLMVESFGRPDFQEGVRSFIEKRPPSFGRVTG